MKISPSAGIPSIHGAEKLRYGATVRISLDCGEYLYEVRRRYMEIINRTPTNLPSGNGGIFQCLGLDKMSISSTVYGYTPDSGGWPEFNTNDYAALARLLDELATHNRVLQITVS